MVERIGILSITGENSIFFNENSNYCKMILVLDRTNIVRWV